MPSFEEELARMIRKQPSDLYILPHKSDRSHILL